MKGMGGKGNEGEGEEKQNERKRWVKMKEETYVAGEKDHTQAAPTRPVHCLDEPL